MTEPIPPTNVQLVTLDGQSIPVDCVYTGRDADGMAVWEIVAPDGGWPPVKRLTVEAWPGRTVIQLPLRVRGDDG